MTWKILPSHDILLGCTSATSCLTAGFRRQEMSVVGTCVRPYVCLLGVKFSALMDFYHKLRMKPFRCTHHPDLTSHMHPHTFRTKFRTFLPSLMLFVFHCLLFIVFCSHLFVSLNSFSTDFSQLTFQSILRLFTDLILCGVCKLAFGLCPLSQQIFVYGLFCSYLTADHRWLCLCCTTLGFYVCVPIVLSSGIVFELMSEIHLSFVHITLLMGKGYFYLVCVFLFFHNASKF